MATTMVKDTTNSKWKLTETASTTQTYQKTIKCGGTYMEYDIDISVTTKAGSATTPATSITANPTISVAADGTITANVSGSKSITPTVVSGYVASGTAGTVSVTGTKSQALPTKAAATYTPGTTDQTISGSNSSSTGFYVTGVQKILGDANLVPGNIKSGVSIFGVEGTLTSIAVDDPNVDNAAVAQILEGYEAFDKNGGTLTGTMPNLTGVDLTSSSTSGKTMTLTLNQAGTLYTIKMYAGSTGYVLKDSTFITDTVAASGLDKTSITPSLTAQTATITAGYYPTNRTVTVAAMPQGAVTTPATTITVTPAISSTYTSGSGYKLTVSATQGITPSVTTNGYVTSTEATSGTITVADDGITYVAQSTLSASSITPNTTSAQTVTIGAGYYPTSRTVTVGKVATGAITLAASIGSNTVVATDSNGSAYSIGQSAQPSGTNYVKLTPTASVTASAPSANFTPGYISSRPSDATKTNQAGTAVYLTIYDGTIE